MRHRQRFFIVMRRVLPLCCAGRETFACDLSDSGASRRIWALQLDSCGAGRFESSRWHAPQLRHDLADRALPLLPPVRRTITAGGLRAKPRPVASNSDERRGSSASRGYGGRWQTARATFLSRQPLCCCCKANGLIVEAKLVDHIIPHRGDMVQFWKSELWQALCNDCHEWIKKPLEFQWERGEVKAEQLNLDRVMPEHFG